MAFLNKMSDSITQAGKKIVNKSQDLTSQVQTKSELQKLKEKQDEIIVSIGKVALAVADSIDNEQISILAKQYKEAEEKSEALRNKMGQRTCPKCYSVVEVSLPFCPKCGEKLPKIILYNEEGKQIIKCPQCGGECTEDEKFCHTCGFKLMDLSNNSAIDSITPDIKKCPACGQEIVTGVKFCNYCGTKQE